MRLFNLAAGTAGTCNRVHPLDRWIITSDVATVDENEDLTLRRGDVIRLNGDVIRNGQVHVRLT